MQCSPDLVDAARAAAACLGIGSTEDVLVVFNEPQAAIAESLASAAGESARSVRLVEYATSSRDGEEPPQHVADAMLQATVIFASTGYSISHTRARRQATARGARVATLPGITRETFRRALEVDYWELARATKRIAERLSEARSCRVTSAAGTDLVLEFGGRVAISDDGDLHDEAAWGNLPAGEAFIAPVEGVAEGWIVFDGALAGYGMLREPLVVRISGGRAVESEGEAADWLLSMLDAGGLGGRLLAELGIGTNPNAILTGHILEDEKAVGTAHVAFGSSVSFGGTNNASVHIDGLLVRPSIELDGRPWICQGELIH